ncbi:hypothetical protein AVEN_1166-1 [Araneus ventricosus]|uniref:Uncharacterized protein n=1 Tax=Araneus ventricosus TaxID=182803 RepID=A0A4Y2EER4_ARAVE|nr:hypothetical protein AVEN_1166-1 [Araneus ventricosus]
MEMRATLVFDQRRIRFSFHRHFEEGRFNNEKGGTALGLASLMDKSWHSSSHTERFYSIFILVGIACHPIGNKKESELPHFLALSSMKSCHHLNNRNNT